jgi:hypothetical protein
MPAEPAAFDAWVHYCFTQGYANFQDRSHLSDEQALELETRYDPDPVTLAGYLTRLFRSPTFLGDRYTPDQLADGTWYTFGVATQWFSAATRPPVPADAQLDLYASVATLYTQLYDKRCGYNGKEPDTDLSGTVRLDTAVYMIWDMDGGIDTPLMFPDKKRLHLLEPGFALLRTILTTCRTAACRQSALHALGHLAPYQPARVHPIIDAFLKSRSPAPPWLRDYARQAREGLVQ